MCQRLLNSSAVSPSHKEFCGCAAMPAVIFFIIPNSLFCGISSKPNLSQQALCTFSHCPFFSLLPNHSPNINVASPRCCHPGRGCDGPLLPWSGSPSSWLARPAVRVCVGGRPASGGTHNSHTRVFLPSQLSRAVIAGLSSDEWLLFSPPTATGWRHGQCESRCNGMCQLGLQWLIAGFAQTERPHTHTHAVNLTVLERHSSVPPRFS